MLNLILRTSKMTLECQIFDEKALKISPSLFLIYGRQTVPVKKAWRLPLLSFRDHLFFLGLFCLVTSQANYSMSEGLAIVRLSHHRFLTKRGQFTGCLHACSVRTVGDVLITIVRDNITYTTTDIHSTINTHNFKWSRYILPTLNTSLLQAVIYLL